MTHSDSHSEPATPGQSLYSPEEYLQSWHTQLTPVDSLQDEQDLELLRQQLASAHQLLDYQASLIHSLTSQLSTQESVLKQTEQALAQTEQRCEQQALQLEEDKAVAQDLRAQLRLQSRRYGEDTKTVSQVPASARFSHSRVASTRVRTESVSFGYETLAEIQSPGVDTKSPPVRAWSASETFEITSAVAVCRKLSTLIVTSGAPSRSPMRPQPSATASSYRVELPKFI
jgi:hypothetical protein